MYAGGGADRSEEHPRPAALEEPAQGRKGLSRRGSWLWAQTRQAPLEGGAAEPDGWTPPLIFGGLQKVRPPRTFGSVICSSDVSCAQSAAASLGMGASLSTRSLHRTDFGWSALQCTLCGFGVQRLRWWHERPGLPRQENSSAWRSSSSSTTGMPRMLPAAGQFACLPMVEGPDGLQCMLVAEPLSQVWQNPVQWPLHWP